MRISIVGRSVKPGSFVSHIADASRALGHDTAAHQIRMLGEPRRGRLANLANVARTDFVSRRPIAIRGMYQALIGSLRRAQPDLIITTLGRVTREEVDSWRNAAPHARVVLWFPDHLANFGRQQAFGAGLDRIYVKDPYVLDRLGARSGLDELRYLPEGAPADAIEWAQANATPSRTSSVAMVGNIYPTRVRFLEALVDAVEVDIYGRLHNDGVPSAISARFTGQFLSGIDKYKVFRDARGVLNNLHYAEVDSVNYRLFEAAACRGVVLVDALPQIARYLEPAKEVLTFESARDLVGTLKEVTDNELAAIGDAAHRRIASEHLISHRLAELLDDVGLR